MSILGFLFAFSWLACIGYMVALYLRYRDRQILALLLVSSVFGLVMVATTYYEPLDESIRRLPNHSLPGVIRDVGPWLVVIVGLASLFALALRSQFSAAGRGATWRGKHPRHGDRRPHRLGKGRRR